MSVTEYVLCRDTVQSYLIYGLERGWVPQLPMEVGGRGHPLGGGGGGGGDGGVGGWRGVGMMILIIHRNHISLLQNNTADLHVVLYIDIEIAKTARTVTRQHGSASPATGGGIGADGECGY